MAHLVEIDDPADPRLADYRDLRDVELRKHLESEQGLFIAEGEKVVRRAVEAGYAARSFLMARRWLDGLADVLDTADAPCYVVVEDARRAGHRLPRPPRRPRLAAPPPAARGRRGPRRRPHAWSCSRTSSTTRTSARCSARAAALGVDAVLLSPRCADPLYRRSVKVAMGAVFAVPWTRARRLVRRAADAVGGGVHHRGADAGRRRRPIEEAVAGMDRVALVMGTEGHGLSDRWLGSRRRARGHPDGPGIDSLNVAAATAVACYVPGAAERRSPTGPPATVRPCSRGSRTSTSTSATRRCGCGTRRRARRCCCCTGIRAPHATWHRVAPLLVAAGYTVVCPDLRGYGRSSQAADRRRPRAVSQAGHGRRPGRADGPARARAVRRGRPRPRQLRRPAGGARPPGGGRRAWPCWTACRSARRWPAATPGSPPLVALVLLRPAGQARARDHRRPRSLVRRRRRSEMGAENYAEYRRAIHDPETVRAMLEDYRAGLGVDRARRGGGPGSRAAVACPTLVLWSRRDDMEELYGDPLAVWRDGRPTCAAASDRVRPPHGRGEPARRRRGDRRLRARDDGLSPPGGRAATVTGREPRGLALPK